MRHFSRSHTHDQSAMLGIALDGAAAHNAQPPRSQFQAPVAVCVSGPDEPAGTYEHGASLGCPDCATGEIHCCPFFWADELDEPQRSQVLRHMRGALRDVIAETHGASGRWSQ